MRVLILCQRFPYPLTDGQSLRICNYATRLSERHQFDLVCVEGGDQDSPVSSVFDCVVTLSAAGDSKPRHRLREMFRVDAFSPYFPAVEAYLRRAIPERGYDVLWTASDMIRSIPARPGVAILADICDDNVLLLRRELAQTRDPMMLARLYKRLTVARQFERRHYAPSEACLFASEVDAASFRAIAPGARVAVIANGVDSQYFTPSGQPPDNATLVFEGTMDFPPNVDAAVYLVTELMPRIWARRPEVRVVLVGRDPTPRVQALAGKRVEVTGYVDDIRPYVSAATVFVCPLRTGAGIKNKILQAWAMGKAVVATPESVGGLAHADGKNILVRHGPEAFVDAAIRLLDDREMRECLGRRARETVVAHYTWEAKAGELEQLMLSIAKPGRNSQAVREIEAQPR